MELDNDQDLQDAQYLSQRYPELDYWRKCINDQDLRGFVTDDSGDDDNDSVNNHNLSNLLEILENSDASKKGNDSDDDDKEWDEMCQILSQKSNNTGFDGLLLALGPFHKYRKFLNRFMIGTDLYSTGLS